MKEETNSRVLKIKHKLKSGIHCAICPPHKGCNKKYKKHGSKKPKYKDK